MQNSLNKDLQHLKWQQQKSWISFPDCRDEQDKQQMQYLLTPRSKWKMHRRYWKFPKRNVQTFGFVYRSTNGLNHGPVWKTQSFLLSEICTVILLACPSWERQFEKVPIEVRMGKVPNWECFLVNREKGLFLSVYVDDVKMAGKKQNIDPMWNILMKDVDLGELTSFIDHVSLGWDVWIQDVSWWYRKIPYSEKSEANILSWSYDMEGHAKKCVENIQNFRTKRLNSYTKSQLHVLKTINSKKKYWNPWENCQKYALKLSWSVCIWLELVDLISCGL